MSNELNPHKERCCGRRLPSGHNCLDGFDDGRYYACQEAHDRQQARIAKLEVPSSSEGVTTDGVAS